MPTDPATTPNEVPPGPATSVREPLIEAVGINKSFRDERGTERLALQDVSFPVMAGEAVCVLGPSGCGKSTLLRTLLGLDSPTLGEVRYRGRPLSGLCPNAAVVFQNFALFPWLTVFDNIRVGLNGRRMSAEEEIGRVRRVLDLVGLEGYEQSRPRELSRGMKQRVSLARALVGRPEILFLDEPFAGLDVLTAEAMRSELYRLWRDQETGLKSIVLVTHQIDEAVNFGDRIVILAQNPGRVREVVANTVRHPREARTRQFIEMVDHLHGILTGIHLPDLTAHEKKVAATRPIPLPRIGVSEIVGLLEVVHDQGDRMDLFEVNEVTQEDFGHTIGVVKAAELLGFVETPGDSVMLSAEGRSFVAEDMNARKRRFKNRLMSITTFKRVVALLEKQEERTAKGELLEDDFALVLPTEPPRPLLETIVRWGQWAELLVYDAERDVVGLVTVPPAEPPPA